MNVDLILIFLFTIVLFGIYLAIRNHCVYCWRINTIWKIHDDLQEEVQSGKFPFDPDYIANRYEELPPYEHMLLWRFWRWPLNKFTPKTLKEKMENMDIPKESA